MTGGDKVAGVMGWPVTHSLSPKLHQYWIRKYHVKGEYRAFPVQPEALKEAFHQSVSDGVVGWNLTVPHKEAAMALVDAIDEEARIIGAVNTVIVRQDKSIYGINTDSYGFSENLKQQTKDLPDYRAKALVLGAGGASRAVIRALQRMGFSEIVLTNRTQVRAEAVAESLGGVVSVVAWEKRNQSLEDVTLLVNTTTLGMRGQLPLDIDLAPLPGHAVVSDIVYAPLKTDLLMQAEKRGLHIVTGLGMLIHQAVPAFAAWFGITPKVTPDMEGMLLS